MISLGIIVIVIVIILGVIAILSRPKFNLEIYNPYLPQELPYILYINLAHDTTRNHHMLQLFQTLHYPQHLIIRVEAILKKPGREGCRLSHVKANKLGIKLCKQSTVPYFIVCEDDLKLVGNLYQSLVGVSQFYPFDMILLECGNGLECQMKLTTTPNPNLFRIMGGGNNTGCYITTPSYATQNIRVWENTPGQHADHSWQILWKNNKVYIHRPVIFVQLGLYSNIINTKRVTNRPFDFDFWEQKQRNPSLCQRKR